MTDIWKENENDLEIAKIAVSNMCSSYKQELNKEFEKNLIHILAANFAEIRFIRSCMNKENNDVV